MNHLKSPTVDHIHQEETDLFAAIRNKCSVEQQQQSTTDFNQARKQLQTKIM